MSHRFLRPPSAATVIASVSLFVSLGGVSYGLATGSISSREIKDNTVRSTDLRDGSIRGKDIRTGTMTGADVARESLTGGDVRNDSLTGADITEASLGIVPAANTLQGRTLRQISQWAVVGAAGQVVRSSGTVTATRLGTGRYRVLFPGDLTGCAYNVNAGIAGLVTDTDNFENRFAMVGQSSVGAPSAVRVEVVDAETRLPADNPFHLTVQC